MGRPRGVTYGTPLHLRLSAEEQAIVERHMRARGGTAAAVVREAIRAYGSGPVITDVKDGVVWTDTGWGYGCGQSAIIDAQFHDVAPT